MSCSSAVCCTNTCSRQAGVASTLGFSGGAPSCCRAPCPNLPLHQVVVCLKINSATQVLIQQGCRPACDVDGPDCDVILGPGGISYNYGITENSWGKKCRVVEFNQKVQTGRYLRFRLCSNDGCYAGTCDDIPVSAYSGARINNALLQFKVDGLDFVPYYNQILAGGGFTQIGCSTIRCYGPTGGCCDDTTLTGNVNSLPIGTEIIFGPVGEAFFTNVVVV